MATIPLVSEHEYLTTAYEPDAEFVDGVIEERNLGEDDHSAWQGALVTFFNMHAIEWNIRVRPELRNKVAERRYRVPDVALLDFDLPKVPIAVQPPLTIFEILSPEDRYKRLLVRLNEFEAMGVPAIYVVDPEYGTFRRFTKGELRLVDAVCLRDQVIDARLIRNFVR